MHGKQAVSGAPVDGRHARRERGRIAVIDALFTLIEANERQPSAERIAAEAGVSAASLFRYFDTLDDLYQQTIDRYFERFAPLFEIPAMGEGPTADRVRNYVDSRLDLYVATAPLARRVRIHAQNNALLADTLRQRRLVMADQVRRHFAPELSRLSLARSDDAVGTIDTTTSLESWDHLTLIHGRTRRQISRAWTDAITGALNHQA